MNHEYHLQASTARVDFYTSDRLCLQPQGVMHRGREELRQALKHLQSKRGHGLSASLTTLCHGFFDVENILFYNVGPARFRAASLEGLAFRLNHSQPDRLPFAYHHRYELHPIQPALGEPHLAFELERLNSKLKPHHVWWNARQGQRADMPLSLDRFRLSVAIEGPGHSPGLSVIAKILLDGIACALHHAPGEPHPLAISAIAGVLGVDAEQVGRTLRDSSAAPLGPRRNLLYPYRNFVKWNPADERCIDCSLQWKPSQSDKVRVAIHIHPAA